MEPGFNDFLAQIPLGLIVMLCGSAALLLIAVSLMINARARRAQARLNGGLPPAVAPRPATDGDAALSMDDMPDLDALLSAENMTAAVTLPVPGEVSMPTASVTPSASAVSPAPTGTFQAALSDGGVLEVVEVLSVLRDVTDGGLVIRIGDKLYRNPPALADAEFKRRFNAIVGELGRSLSNARPAAPPAAVERPADADLPPVDALSGAGSAAVDELLRATGTMPGAVPGDLPKFILNETPPPLRPLRRTPKPTNEPIPAIDVGGSVEAYLQHKISQSPEFAGRRLHIRPNLRGEIVIEVDGKFYESIGDVEDEAARTFLAAVVEEWQARQ
ncbi:MAG: hypothetical protein SF162_18120 [bacterium]|nr:hypothetical protein [bacterium]